jgi:hypothetical protein
MVRSRFKLNYQMTHQGNHSKKEMMFHGDLQGGYTPHSVLREECVGAVRGVWTTSLLGPDLCRGPIQEVISINLGFFHAPGLFIFLERP